MLQKKNKRVAMSKKDQEKWDRKYREHPRLREPRPPMPWIEELIDAVEEARALDLACGTGRNALALAQKGWRVKGVEISPVALQILTEAARETGLQNRIDTKLIDLEHFTPAPGSYGLILMCNYLDRELIRRTIPALHSGGLYLVETYMEHPDNEKKEANPDYLLRPGELREIFAPKKGWEILRYEEFWNEGYEMHQMRKQAILARKR